MDTIKQVEAQREAVLKQMRAIRSMERGSITEQFLKVPHKGKKEPVLRGPYYVITRREGNKTVGYRLKAEDLERARGDVEAHKKELSDDLEGIRMSLDSRLPMRLRPSCSHSRPTRVNHPLSLDSRS